MLGYNNLYSHIPAVYNTYQLKYHIPQEIYREPIDNYPLGYSPPGYGYGYFFSPVRDNNYLYKSFYQRYYGMNNNHLPHSILYP